MPSGPSEASGATGEPGAGGARRAVRPPTSWLYTVDWAARDAGRRYADGIAEPFTGPGSRQLHTDDL
ncbi:hypothetical protein I6A84_18250 [Frankia sp. CNm7]|uniref:Uncharacterized protein n=1 Tax=Frankia nepalensis TaxID=1836974 RepID=A0A937RF89_9ACTN|nr:hypothetical protein [Frankia nepalensis]MBL7501862.1 hypothetical protein [Frankia nepalensis]MBL7513802.1 hypothetical protein [Frankia nepalensis]MBL7519983.1 hypothetical protein [Frankia nepalensis]MBL7629107.1 hypothetical protein [Frankia nepalensis]